MSLDIQPDIDSSTPGLYRNVIQVEILSNYPWADGIEDLSIVHYQITDGDSSGSVERIVVNEQVSAERMAELLTAQGSDPSFLLDPVDGKQD